MTSNTHDNIFIRGAICTIITCKSLTISTTPLTSSPPALPRPQDLTMCDFKYSNKDVFNRQNCKYIQQVAHLDGVPVLAIRTSNVNSTFRCSEDRSSTPVDSDDPPMAFPFKCPPDCLFSHLLSIRQSRQRVTSLPVTHIRTLSRSSARQLLAHSSTPLYRRQLYTSR